MQNEEDGPTNGPASEVSAPAVSPRRSQVARIPDAAMLEKLPVTQRIVVKQALRAASDAQDEVEVMRAELIRAHERLQCSEKELAGKSAPPVIPAEQMPACAPDPPKFLAAGAFEGAVLASDRRAPGVYAAIALLAMAGCAFPFVHDSSSAVSVPSPEPAPAGPPIAVQVSEPRPARVTEAFDRLDRALAGVPVLERESVILEANQWLEAAGSPPCTVGFAGKKTSLLVTFPARVAGDDGPLAASLLRCALAVEHFVE
jgi:hypothetical protein